MFGITKQAFYKRIARAKIKEQMNEVILQNVAEIRKEMPKIGTRKLYEYLKPILLKLGIKIGRDALFKLLRSKQLLIKK